MHKPGVFTALGEDRFDALLLAKGVMAADELDLQLGLGRDLLGVGAQLMAKRFGPARIVEQANMALRQIASQGLAVTDLGQRSRDNDAVEAGENAGDFVLVSLNKGVHGRLRGGWALPLPYQQIESLTSLYDGTIATGKGPTPPPTCLVPAMPG